MRSLILTLVLVLACLGSGLAGAAEPAAGIVIRPGSIEPDGRFRWLPEPRPSGQPEFAVALGSGAAWGIAHLGVLEAMLDDGLRPDMIAGTSVGALVGATLAAGHTIEDAEDLLRMEEEAGVSGESSGLRRTERAYEYDPLSPGAAFRRWGRSWNGEALHGDGAISDQRIVVALANYLARADALSGGDLDRLAFPFRAVATDLNSGESYSPRQTSLVSIVRASIGLPVFAPVALDGRLLVDGGAVEAVPIPAARRMGADLVIGVRVSTDGNGLQPFRGSRRFRPVARRYTAMIEADQRKRLLDEADLVIEAKVGDRSIIAYAGRVPELIQAGRDAWERAREDALRLLESHATDGEMIEIAAIGGETPRDERLAVALSRYLGVGGETATRSRFRVELALCRLMRTHELRDAALELSENGRARLVTVPQPPVLRLELEVPASIAGHFDDLPAEGGTPRTAMLEAIRRRVSALEREGYMLAGISDVNWEDDGGVLTVRIEEGLVDSFRLHDGAGSIVTPARLQDLEDLPARSNAVSERLEDLDQRQRLFDPRISGARAVGAGRYRLDVLARPLPRWETSFNLGVADGLGLTGWARFRMPQFNRSTAWGLDLRLSTGRESTLATLDLGPASRDGWSPAVRLQAGQPSLLRYDARGRRFDSQRFDFGLVGAGVRWENMRAGVLELLAEGRYVSAEAFPNTPRAAAALAGSDAGIGVHWWGDWHRRSTLPLPGFSWSLDLSLPLAGEERAPSLRGDLVSDFPLDRRDRWSIVAAGRFGAALGDDPLPLDRWAEAGSWWEAPPLAPGQSRARSLVRASVILSRRFNTPFGFPFYVNGTLAWWHLDEDRADRFLDDDGFGGSVFLEVPLWRRGSIFLGLAEGDEEGDRLYLLIGASRPRWP